MLAAVGSYVRDCKGIEDDMADTMMEGIRENLTQSLNSCTLEK